MTEHNADDWTLTYTGLAFRLDAPQFRVDDIAFALAKQCRYAGHTSRFYSVLDHTIILHDWLMRSGCRSDVLLAALFHDAGEAYLVDVPAPVKRRLPDYQKLEKKLDADIATWLGLKTLHPPEVRDADLRILLDERAVLLPTSPEPWNAVVEKARPLGIARAEFDEADRRSFGRSACEWKDRVARVAPHLG